MMGRGPMMHGFGGFGLRRLPRSAGRGALAGWPMALVRDRPARRRPVVLAPVPPVHGSHGGHHSRRVGVGRAPRDRAACLAFGRGRAARQRLECSADGGDRHDRDATSLARLQHHAGAPARPDREPDAHAGGDLARPAHALDAAAAARRRTSRMRPNARRCWPPSPRWTPWSPPRLHSPGTRRQRKRGGRTDLAALLAEHCRRYGRYGLAGEDGAGASPSCTNAGRRHSSARSAT